MRYIPSMFNKLSEAATGGFIGDRKTNGRVTVEPLWQLKATPPSYGNSIRGPYRYFQDVNDSGVQWEVPNIKNISWDRQESQDLASCTITLYNMWHEGNLEEQELEGQLGKPGYFWPKRGLEINRWNQLGGKGSMRKDGFWDPNFSWQNVLVQYALVRTYEGFVNPNALSSSSIQDDLDDECLVQTGTWLIDFVSAGSNGEMVLNCKDMGKLLLDQACFPPIIPDGLYPLEYYPAGKSAFDSVFGAKPKTGVSPGSQGEVKGEYVASSADEFNEGFDVDIYGHKGSYAVDGNWLTSAWSEAHPLPAATVYWDFDILDPISKLSIKTWAGGYECYVSIMRDNEWLAGEIVPGLSEPYLVKINIPFAIPDNNEPVINIELPDSFKNLGDTGYAQRVKISLRNLYYSGAADGDDFYRGGIRDLIFYREGAKVDPYTPDFATIPWTFSMCAHPTRGYWVIDDGGNVYGFGDAADYDSTAFGPVPLAARSGHDDNQSIAMCAHPDGKGYWVLDRMGHVYPYGSAEFYGEYEVAWPGTDKWGEDGLAAWDITPTHTGNGYWVCYGDGHIRGFGDAAPNDVILPWSDVAMFMNSVVNPRYLYQHQANGITSHPTKMGFWVTTGSGEVYAFGDAVHYGQLDQRVYNRGMADTFMLAKTEYTKSIEATKSGNGYWIAFGSGHIAAFGDAVGQGPSYIYPQNNTGIDIPIDETNIIDWSFFRAIVWDMARDPDGTGFWVLVADGNVGSYSAEFWGSPGYQGLTGFRWHEGNFDGEYCVDTETEILTKRGWLRFDEVREGDLSYSLNPLTGKAEWKSVQAVNIFEAKHRKMLEYKHQTFSSLTTKNHRWIYRDWKNNLKFREAKDLAMHNKLIRCAGLDKTTKIFDDDFVELMAWVTAEGWVDSGRVRFAQSQIKNPIYHNRIINLLTKIYGPPGNMKNGVTRFPNMLEAVDAVKNGMSFKEASRKFKISIGGIKVWYNKEELVEIPLAANWGADAIGKNGVQTFSIRKDLSEEILSYMENGKVPSWEFVNQLTCDQANLFLQIFCMGDGNNTSDIYAGVAQRRESTIDAVQAIASIAGIATNKKSASLSKDNMNYLGIYKSDNTSFFPKYMNEIDYYGKIWCPTIEDNTTWLARKDGCTFFTGNSSILSELLKWCGFTLYNPAIGSSDPPEVFGALESTGIKTDTFLSAEKFDKRPIIDVIKELCEVVGYRFLVQEDGSIKISSPNIWRSGNFDIDGIRIYVDDEGNRVDPDDPDAIEFIPMIDEEVDMFDYNTTLSSESMRSEIIIGNELPNPSDPRVTSFIRHTPRSGSELVAPGIPMLRGISRVGIWTSQMFQNLEEMKLMAELISLNAWFAERTGTVNCIANPLLSLGDQVKLAERNTSEYNIHYISGISSNHDLDTGVWTYTLTTHWLGDADNWVITANESAAPVDGYHYIEISERVDRWQQDTNRGLLKGSQAHGEPGNENLIEFYGEFDKSSTPLYTQTIPSPSTTKLYSMPDWDDGFSTTFPPPPQGGMTYVNRLYDESDISQLDIEMEVFNVAPADSMLYLQLYDGDCGDAGQYFGWQTQSLLLWSQFGTNDLDNIEAGPGATTVSDEELGAPFIGLRKVLPTDYLDPGVYNIRVERNEFDNSAWGDASYAFGGDWFSMYAKIPSGEEFLLGRMRFPREASGVPAAFHDNGGEWMEAYENNNDITLFPVDYLHVATRAKANGQDAISATSTVSLMPNLDIWAEEPKSSWVHHEIGGDIVRHHNTGTLWNAGTTIQSDNIVNKIVWQYIPYATSYKVYRGETADDMDLIATTTDFVFFDKEWNDTNRMNPALDYVYGISAITEDGESAIGIYDPENSRRDDQWLFEGVLKLNKAYDNLYFKVEALTAPLGEVVFLELYQNGALVWNQEIKNVNQPILLPNVGATTYSFHVSGYPSKTGNGYLKLNISDSIKSFSTTDTLLVTR